MLEPVLSALAAAHRAGIVHRDVKPENVLLADDGRVKVADFGLARSALDRRRQHRRPQGVVIGTVAYLAPEQVERGTADAALATCTPPASCSSRCSPARKPYAGDTADPVAYQHVHDDVPAAVDAGARARRRRSTRWSSPPPPATRRGGPPTRGRTCQQVRSVRGTR